MKLQPTFGFLLNDSARLLSKRFGQRARGLGLTRAQWQVLAYIARNEGIQQSALADMLELEPITLVRILDRLEEAGFLERRRNASDRRVRQLYLLPKTHDVLETMLQMGDAVRREALEGISEADRATLIRCLETIRANLAAAPPLVVDEARRA